MNKNSWTCSILCNVYITAVYNIPVYTAKYVEKQSILSKKAKFYSQICRK